jgi:2-methylcitrate dehydratase PrpD
MYPAKVPARIEIELEDGSRHDTLHDYPLGHSRNPMSAAQIDAKFFSLCGRDARTEALLADLYRIGELDAAATTSLLRRAAGV